MEIKNVGVVGCGLMGSGIAQVSADSGYQTVVHEIDDQILGKGLGAVERFLSQGVRKGKLTEERKKEILGRIRGTTRLTDLGGADLIVEAIVEDLEAKMKLYRALDDVAKQDTIFASNTSSLCITEMASGTRRPGRFVGLHFFNPVPLMKVVEVITTIMTEPIVPDVVIGFARSLGKTPIRAPDRPGFVGLDTTYYIANIMYQEFKEKRFAPPPLLRRMVLAGLLGRKSGKGFYDYT